MMRLGRTGLTLSQTESRTKMDEYNVAARKLNSELEMLKHQKTTMKNQIVRPLHRSTGCPR